MFNQVVLSLQEHLSGFNIVNVTAPRDEMWVLLHMKSWDRKSISAHLPHSKIQPCASAFFWTNLVWLLYFMLPWGFCDFLNLGQKVQQLPTSNFKQFVKDQGEAYLLKYGQLPNYETSPNSLLEEILPMLILDMPGSSVFLLNSSSSSFGMSLVVCLDFFAACILLLFLRSRIPLLEEMCTKKVFHVVC